MKNALHHESRLGAFQIALLFLTILLLSALVLDTLTEMPTGVSQIIHWMDTSLCALFLIDFAIRFRRAESKLAFLKWGWIDLVASIPNINFLRWGRLVRVLRVIRLLRGIRSVQRVFEMLLQDPTHTGFASIGLTAFLLVVFSSVSILICERTPEANIKTAEDAVWWSVSTVSTVGYGDKFPVTTEGRMIGMALMIAGVGLFGGLSGLVASLFLGAREAKTPEHKEIVARLERLQRSIDGLGANQTSGGDQPTVNV